MKLKTISILICICFGGCVHSRDSADKDGVVSFKCDEFDWQDIEQLVQPYISDLEYTALVMQGQSSEYSIFAAARQILAYKRELPQPVMLILESIVDADCL